MNSRENLASKLVWGQKSTSSAFVVFYGLFFRTKGKEGLQACFSCKGTLPVYIYLYHRKAVPFSQGLLSPHFQGKPLKMVPEDKNDPVSNLDRVGKIRHLHVYIPLYLWECPGLFSDRSFHKETASVHRNKTRCVLWSWEGPHCVRKGLQTGMCAPQTASLLLPLHSFLAGTDFHCVLLSLVSPVKLIVAWSQTQPLDVYSHLGWAIKMMNELASCPGKGALRVDIDTRKIISLFRPFSVFNPVPQAPW